MLNAGADSQETKTVGGVRMGGFGNCVIFIWNGQVGEAEIDALNEHTTHMTSAWPEGITMLALVEPNSPMPGAEERKRIEGYYRRHAENTRAACHVAEGTGLWAVMARSVMTAVRLIQSRPYPTRVFAVPEEGITWLGEHIKAHSATRPAEAIEGLRKYVAEMRAGG